MNIAFIGPSMAGKGTQADKLIPKLDLLHIATGDIFRESLENQTALGVLAQKYMDQGELVPDDVVEAMVEEFVKKADPQKGILFDGFPRTMYQTKFLDDLLKEAGRQLDAVIYLKVSKEEILKRLPGRKICRKCQSPFHKVHNPFQACAYNICQGEHLYQRDDDNPETIRARLRVFHRESATLIDYYQQSGKLIIIDGERSIEQVHQEIMAALEAVRRSETRAATLEEAQQITALKDVRQALSREQAKHHSLDVILLGAPGSGKGTQAVQLGKMFNIRRVATGDLFRKNIEEKTKLGKLAKKYMDRGELVPDNVTEAMVRERLSRKDTHGGFILDGFPRTLPQAEALTEIMTDMNRRIDLVIYLKVPDDEIIERLSGRLICRKCQSPFHKMYNPFQSCPYNQCEGEFLYQREDDLPETVGNRLRTFHRQTAPLIQYYSEAGLLVEINGVGEVTEVFEQTLAVVRKIRDVEGT